MQEKAINYKINTIDLFAGCGGLTDGFEQTNFYNTLACVEWEKMPCLTLSQRLKKKWGLDAEKIRATIKKKFDIVMAGGQDHLNGKIFRIGHLGFVGDRDILTAISALEASISALGYSNFTYGAGIKAA